MKKFNLFLTITLCFSIISCNNNGKTEDKENNPEKTEKSEEKESKSEISIKEGIWVKDGNIGKADFINKGDYQYFFELRKSGDAWTLSIPCDMETLKMELKQSGNILKNDSEGFALEFDGNHIKVSGERAASCQTIAKSYSFLPECNIRANTPEAGFFRGEYKAVGEDGNEFDIKFDPYGITSGWKNYTAYKFNDITNDNMILFRNPDDDNIFFVVPEIKNDKMIFYECIKCDDLIEEGVDLKKGKKLLTLTRK